MREPVKQLFLAIYRGDVPKLGLHPLSSDVLNYQLTNKDIDELLEAVGHAKLESGRIDGFEEGMTPLLLALSRERLTIANRLMSHAELDVTRTNKVGIGALHMLLMISFGDQRYGEDGKQIEALRPSVTLVEDLMALATELIHKGCSLADSMVGGVRVNLLAEAIFHMQLGVAGVMVSQGAPLPKTTSQLARLQHYYTMNLERTEDAVYTSRLRLEQVYMCLSRSNFFVRVSNYKGSFFADNGNFIQLTNASVIKSLLSELAIDRKTRGLKPGVSIEGAIKLIDAHFTMANVTGYPIQGIEFKDFLRGYGRDLPVVLKEHLEAGSKLALSFTDQNAIMSV